MSVPALHYGHLNISVPCTTIWDEPSHLFSFIPREVLFLQPCSEIEQFYFLCIWCIAIKNAVLSIKQNFICFTWLFHRNTATAHTAPLLWSPFGRLQSNWKLKGIWTFVYGGDILKFKCKVNKTYSAVIERQTHRVSKASTSDGLVFWMSAWWSDPWRSPGLPSPPRTLVRTGRSLRQDTSPGKQRSLLTWNFHGKSSAY